MPGHVSIFEPWIPASVEKSMDLIHHAAERMPADSSLHALPIKRGKITYPMSEGTLSFLLDDFNFDAIGSFHPLFPRTPSLQPLKGFTQIGSESI
jgi:hypothetical protein